MPTTESSSESKPVRAVPGQLLSWSAAGGTSPWPAVSAIPSLTPCQPPTRSRPSSVSGVRAATMTKNCSTSL